ALEYVEARFDSAAVLSRHDHGRRWPRVTLVVSTDPTMAKTAPPLTELAHPPEPVAPPQPVPTAPVERPRARSEVQPEPEPIAASGMPTDLEAIFAHQNDLQRR